MEQSDILPVRGFVYKRKEFFASLENLTDIGIISSSPSGTSITSNPSFNSKITPTTCSSSNTGSLTRPRFRRANSSEQFQERVETYERLKEKVAEAKAKPLRRGHSKGNQDDTEKKKEENAETTMTKWQSLSALDEEIKNYEKSLSIQQMQPTEKPSSNGKSKADSSPNGDSNKTAPIDILRKGASDKKFSKPHWTTLFSQRLSQIRQRFEKQSKQEVSADEYGGSLQRSSFRGSNSSLSGFSDSGTSTNPEGGLLERRDSGSEVLTSPQVSSVMFSPLPVSMSLNGSNGSAKPGNNTGTKRNGNYHEPVKQTNGSGNHGTSNGANNNGTTNGASNGTSNGASNGTNNHAPNHGPNPAAPTEETNSKKKFLEVYHTLEKKSFLAKPQPQSAQTFKVTTQVTVTQKKPELTKIKQIYQTLEHKNRQNDLYRTSSLDTDEYMCRKQNDLFDKWGPFGPIQPTKSAIPWKMELKPTPGSKTLLRSSSRRLANTNVYLSDGAKGVKEGDSVSVKSAVTPACLPSEGFTADDLVKERTTLKDWDPTKLMQELYKIQLVPEEEEDFFEHITMEGYMEKLPINKKKATLLKTWKRRFFKAQEGYLHYYEPPDTVRPKTEDGKDSDKPSGSIQLMGGSIETLDNRMIGIDDGRGRYLVVRAPTEADCEDWCRALKSQTIENIKASWVKPVVHAIPSRRRNVVIIDIGSCSVRAGVLGENPSLPSLFFPCIMATSKDTGERVFGFEALLPESRANCTLSYPVRPSVKVDKFAVDMAAIPELFDKIFNDLNVDPSKHWVMFSAPGNFSDKIKQHFMDILVNRFHVIGVNIVAQTLLSLYSYNSRSGIVVDVGERLEIVPVTDGYIVEAGVTRQPYGGHRITEALNSSFTESKYRFFTDVEFQIVRLAMEKSCYVATDYNAESRKCQQNPRPFKKTIHLEQFGLPSGTWKNVTHTQSRFSTTEGLFNTEMWGMDNPMMHKLVAKAVQVCPMDMRREIWRSIFLSGGVTLLPGFAERLQEELTKLAPPSVKVQVHASPQRYHSAYIGACALANLQEFEQACISADEWRETGPPCLRKWHMY